MDIHEIIRIANMHPRVNILQPGPGVGGHCIPVDPWFLVGDYPTMTDLIHTARKVNVSMPDYVLERIQFIMKENNITDSSKVGLYGLTYKEDVDDVRESPTLQILESMNKHLGAQLPVYDPLVSKSEYVKNLYTDFDKFTEDMEIIVIMVAHSHIKENLSKLKGKIVLDTKNTCGIEDCYKL